MNLLPKASGSRPRLACEISPDGVVAARSPEPGLPLAAVAKVDLSEGAISPGLKPGNIADRVAVIAALRRALEGVGARSNARNADLTLVIPDAAVRVLLLDFDSLPNKLSEALPIVRFRLKKLLPFEADDAMVSFQVMSTSRSVVRVLAVAVPRDVLSEYESVARETGFEPGAVLPSTLAALGAIDEAEGASLLVNASPLGVTTAIVRAGIVLLHRAVELVEHAAPTPANVPASLFEPTPLSDVSGVFLPVVDRDATAGEWAAQEPAPEYGRDMYAGEAAPVTRSPYASPGMLSALDADSGNTVLVSPASMSELIDPLANTDLQRLAAFAAPGGPDEPEPTVHTLAPDVRAEEIAQAVSVAVAYFEDSLGVAPEILLSAGPLGAEHLSETLREQGLVQQDGLRVREIVTAEVLAAEATTRAVPRSWLAGVVGALKS